MDPSVLFAGVASLLWVARDADCGPARKDGTASSLPAAGSFGLEHACQIRLETGLLLPHLADYLPAGHPETGEDRRSQRKWVNSCQVARRFQRERV